MMIKPDTSVPMLFPASSAVKKPQGNSQFSTLLNERLQAGKGKNAAEKSADNRTTPGELRKKSDPDGKTTLNELTGLKEDALSGTDILMLNGSKFLPAQSEDERQITDSDAAQALPLQSMIQAVPPAMVAIADQTGAEAAGSSAASALNGSQAALSTAELSGGLFQEQGAARTGADLAALSVPHDASPLGAALTLTEAKYSPIRQAEQGVAGMPTDETGTGTPMTTASVADTPAHSDEHEESVKSDLALSLKNADIGATEKGTTLAATDVTSRVISQPVGTPAWQHALSQQLSYFTRNGIHNAELRLHPEELGALQINLQLNNDRAQLHFITANHHVRAAIEAAMPHLRTSLEESGISLGQSSVGEDASSSWQASSEAEHRSRSSAQRHHEDVESAIDEEPTAVQHVLLHKGINTFV